MQINAAKIHLTNELLALGLQWFEKGVSLTKALTSPQYLVLYWHDLSVAAFEEVLPTLDPSHLRAYLETDHIQRPDLLLRWLQAVETPNEEYLWNRLVDSRLISHELYVAQTYQENFALWYKMYAPSLISLSPPTTDLSLAEVLATLAGPHLSPAKVKEQHRVQRVTAWLDATLAPEFVTVDHSLGLLHHTFSFQTGVQQLPFGLSSSLLAQVAPEFRSQYYENLAGVTAVKVIVLHQKVMQVVFYSEFVRLAEIAGLPQTNLIAYVQKWVTTLLQPTKSI